MDESKIGIVPTIEDWDGKYRINEGYRPIAEALVEKYPELGHIPVDKILFIDNVETEARRKGRYVLAQVGLAPSRWAQIITQLSGVETWYFMEIFRKNTKGLSEEQLVALIYHELRHIGRDGAMVAHDVEDWGNMITALGFGWNSSGKEIPNLLGDEVDWDSILARRLLGMADDEANEPDEDDEQDNAKITIAAAGRSVTTDLGVLKEAAGRVKRAAGSE